MNDWKSPIDNERGAMLLIALLVLALLTIIGMVATTNSTIELQIAANERDHQKAMYAAESGIAHMAAILQSRIVDGNGANLASGNPVNWNFALDGTNPDISAGISRELETPFAYSVQVLDNCDEVPGDCEATANNPNVDADRLVRIRSEGRGPSGTSAMVEILVEPGLDGEAISGYSAQQGGGAGKSSNASDVNPIQESVPLDLGSI